MTARKPGKTSRDKGPDDSALQAALAARDGAAVRALLDAGLDADWRDARGRSLMHYAAAWDDAGLVQALADKGLHARVYDANAETPADLARAFGHDALAQKLALLAQGETPPVAPPLPFKNMAALRAESARTLVDQFNHYVRRGRLGDLLALAAADAEGLTAADLLARGPDGDTALLKICQQGRLGDLMNVSLWKKGVAEFQAAFAQVPADYRAGHDEKAFLAQLRQARLRHFGKPTLKGFKPGPKA